MTHPELLLFTAFISFTAGKDALFTLNTLTDSMPTNAAPNGCPEDKFCRTRTFASLSEYQGNKISFDPSHHDSIGNIVKFKFSSMYTLTKNSFASYGSNSIVKMDLHNQNISSIQSGALRELFCLRNLDFSDNNISELVEGSFEGLENLIELDLSKNHLQEILDNGVAFAHLKSLRVLDFSKNKIQSLKKSSFITLSGLETLDLGHNDIKIIDPRVFNHMPFLKQLYLNDNSLGDILAEQWIGLFSLTHLDLSNNHLSSFDMTTTYSFVNLKLLNLRGNDLSIIRISHTKKTFPNLLSLDLSNNNWSCRDLEEIKNYLSNSEIITPNPVKCRRETSTIGNKIFIETNTNDFEPELRIKEKNLESNVELLDTVYITKALLISVFLVLLIYFAIDFAIRCGYWNTVFRSLRSRRHYVDVNVTENVRLVTRNT